MDSNHNFLLLSRGNVHRIIGPITDDSSMRDARKNLFLTGFKTFKLPKPPSERTLRRWKQKNQMKAIDGCVVDGLCSCTHGNHSWLAVMNKVKLSKSKT